MVMISLTGQAYLSNNINMTCYVTQGKVKFYDVYESLIWMKDNRVYRGDPHIKNPIVNFDRPEGYYSIIRFPYLTTDNNGLYQCATKLRQSSSATILSNSAQITMSSKHIKGIIIMTRFWGKK